jgi:hypothetical protein
MTPEIFKQVLADAFLLEPDVASLYYPRDDSLLLAIYNKAKSGDRSKIDGERKWRAAYRVMPDFENWVKYFADEIVITTNELQNLSIADPAKPTGPVKY